MPENLTDGQADGRTGGSSQVSHGRTDRRAGQLTSVGRHFGDGENAAAAHHRRQPPTAAAMMGELTWAQFRSALMMELGSARLCSVVLGPTELTPATLCPVLSKRAHLALGYAQLS